MKPWHASVWLTLLFGVVANAQVQQGFSFANCERSPDDGHVVCQSPSNEDQASESLKPSLRKSVPGNKLKSGNTFSLQQQIDMTPNGATLTLKPGRYHTGLVIKRPITLNLKGVTLTRIAWDKAPLVIDHREAGAIVINDYVHDGAESGAVTGNLAAARVSGRQFDVTFNRADLRGTSMGILTDNRGGVLRINDSRITDIGGIEGESSLSHVVYAGLIDRLELRNSKLLGSSRLGHILKSRAAITHVSNSVLAGLDQAHSRVIDLACGGELEVIDSVLQASSRADNTDAIAVGVEALRYCHGENRVSRALLKNNTIVFDRHVGEQRNASVFNWPDFNGQLVVKDNVIVAPVRLYWQAPWNKQHDMPKPDVSNRLFNSRQAAGLNAEIDTLPYSPE